MPEPRLTIVVPTLDRADLLHRAIDSCLRQTIPVKVLVADQGISEATATVMRRYLDHPHVEHRATDARCLWENWRAGMQAVTTEFGAWLQDDDVVGRGYAARIVKAFDAYPEAHLWMGRLCLGNDDKVGVAFGGNWPWVPMKILDGIAEPWQGEILIPTAYFTSWALSPAQAFRTGQALQDTLEAIPSDCDLFAERLIPAELGARGLLIADPVIAGYWIHHGRNESYKQHCDQERQTEVMVKHLDRLMAQVEWQDIFMQWCLMMPASLIIGWLDTVRGLFGAQAKAVRELMQESLKGRVESVPDRDMEPFIIGDGSVSFRPRAKANGQALAHAPAMTDEVILFD